MALRNQLLQATMQVTPAAVDTPLSTILATQLDPGDNPNAWRLRRVDFYVDINPLTPVTADLVINAVITNKDPENTLKTYLDNETIVAATLARSAGGSHDYQHWSWEPPEGLIQYIVQEKLWITGQWTGGAVAPVIQARLYYETTRVAQIDALSELRC